MISLNIDFKNVYIGEAEDLADIIIEDINSADRFDIVGVVGHAEEIAAVLKELMCDLITYPGFIDFDIGNEIAEYLLSIDEDGNIDIELIKDKMSNTYINYCADKLYIFADCHSNICSNNFVKDCDYSIVDYADKSIRDDCCDGNCENCHLDNGSKEINKSDCKVNIDKDEDGNMSGITLHKNTPDGYISYSVYSSAGISDKIIDSLLDILE